MGARSLILVWRTLAATTTFMLQTCDKKISLHVISRTKEKHRMSWKKKRRKIAVVKWMTNNPESE